MKPKIILCLALVLIGGLLGCLNISEGQTNVSPQPSLSDIHSIQLLAEIGNVKAQVRLGMAYVGGDGVPKDPVKSFYWFKKAAEQGDTWGEGGIGTAYINGEGVAKDEKEAFKWFKKAADQGFFPAQDQLGVLYVNGTGCEKDLAEAYKWFSLASQQGYQTAAEHKSALVPYMTPDQIYEGNRRAKAFVPISQDQTNQLLSGGSNSNPAKAEAEPRTLATVQAEVRDCYSNFIPLVTNRMGTNFGPVTARALASVETNVLSTLTNSAMVEMGAAVKFLTELKKQGHLPGVLPDSHGDVTTGNLPLSKFQAAKYPFAMTFHVIPTGDSFTNHYTVMRVSADGAWQLQRAWRTDAKDHTIVEWPTK